MADVSHQRTDITSHPDASEMRARYARVLGGRDVALVDGPVFLVGLYCAISPWTVHFATGQPTLATHNLIVGIAIAALALGFTAMPAARRRRPPRLAPAAARTARADRRRTRRPTRRARRGNGTRGSIRRRPG